MLVGARVSKLPPSRLFFCVAFLRHNLEPNVPARNAFCREVELAACTNSRGCSVGCQWGAAGRKKGALSGKINPPAGAPPNSSPQFRPDLSSSPLGSKSPVSLHNLDHRIECRSCSCFCHLRPIDRNPQHVEEAARMASIQPCVRVPCVSCPLHRCDGTAGSRGRSRRPHTLYRTHVSERDVVKQVADLHPSTALFETGLEQSCRAEARASTRKPFAVGPRAVPFFLRGEPQGSSSELRRLRSTCCKALHTDLLTMHPHLLCTYNGHSCIPSR